MKKILLVLPIIFSVFLMSSAMAMIKPFKWERIKAGAFDFSIDSIDTLDDITIGYLEYGRATAYVTKTDLNPSNGGESYSGTLKFYATGIDSNYKTFSVAVYSEGPLDCSAAFDETTLDCTAEDGKMRVRRHMGLGYITELIDLSEFDFYADNDPTIPGGYISVYAEDEGGVTVLDAEIEDWADRVPQMPIEFRYWIRCWGMTC